jgi:hypothetical protein
MTPATDRSDDRPPGGALPRLAGLCLGLMFVVVVASAFLRHHADQTAWAAELALARQVHRVAATLVLLGAIAMLLLARRARDASRTRLAASLLGLALLLSVVGVAGGASRAAPVVLVNLLGGLAMLALCTRLALAPRPSLGRAAAVMLALVALQAVLGALASATASPECVALSDCAAPALMHRVSGVLLALVMLAFGVWAGLWRGRPEGMALALLALAQLIVGTLAASFGSGQVPLAVVLHNALAAAALVGFVRQV